MISNQLGRSGLAIGRLALGTMNFGALTPEPECHKILDCAVEAGINLVDTADIYGWQHGAGLTEQIIGGWLRAAPSRRDSVVLSTKVYGLMGPGLNDFGLSAYHIRQACDASLRRLNTDRIDLYQLHHIDRRVEWREIWEALDRLIREGKILYVGTSNFPAWQIATGLQVAQSGGRLGIVSEQSSYNLMTRQIELEVLPACRHSRIGVLTWAPLAGGLLAGADQGTPRRRASEKQNARKEKHQAQIEAYLRLCDDIGEPPSVVAVAWILSNPVVSAVILGPRTQAHLETTLRAVNLSLDEDVLKALDAIWPGPGEAPEAYAW
jgi:NDP-hexose C3-ketoreductase / dTDP-4-oxo-2-deoxy-alpha-D-pentos-2-ene 2,3-reductase